MQIQQAIHEAYLSSIQWNVRLAIYVAIPMPPWRTYAKEPMNAICENVLAQSSTTMLLLMRMVEGERVGGVGVCAGGGHDMGGS